MSTDVTREFAFGLPKAELHLHLEGTLEPDLKLALARKHGIDIGQETVEEVRATYQFNDLTSFLAVYYPAIERLAGRGRLSRSGCGLFRTRSRRRRRARRVLL